MSIPKSVFERARSDRAFRDRLLADPAATLKEQGASLANGNTIEAIDMRDNEIHLNLGRKGNAPGFTAILEKAGKDQQFRQRLLTNPKAVLQESFAEPLPASTTVHVYEPPPAGVVRLFVPPLERSASEELSDSELEAVAGGGVFKNIAGAIGEWLCKDTHAVEINEKNNSYQIMTDTSNKPPTNTVGSLIVW